MANIATVNVRAYLKTDLAKKRLTRHGMLRLLTYYYGKSYCVPTWGYSDLDRGIIELQYGEKWSPIGLYRLWEQRREMFSALWVRWFNDGADWDRIFCYGVGGPPSSRTCHYGYDRVRIRASDLPPEALGEDWVPAAPDWWERAISGDYFAGNDRCDLLKDHPKLSSQTTPVYARIIGRNPDWERSHLPILNLETRLRLQAGVTDIDFLWRGRPTRVYRMRGGFWYLWALDYWDNCLDPQWLIFRSNEPDVRLPRGDSDAGA